MNTKTALKDGDNFPYELTPGDNLTPPDWAHRAARGVIANMLDRSGIKQELRAIDMDTRKELIASIASVIRQAHIESKAQKTFRKTNVYSNKKQESVNRSLIELKQASLDLIEAVGSKREADGSQYRLRVSFVLRNEPCEIFYIDNSFFYNNILINKSDIDTFILGSMLEFIRTEFPSFNIQSNALREKYIDLVKQVSFFGKISGVDNLNEEGDKDRFSCKNGVFSGRHIGALINARNIDFIKLGIFVNNYAIRENLWTETKIPEDN